MEAILVVFITAILFMNIILLLATRAGKSAKTTGILVAVIALGGLMVYGYGFACTIDFLPMAVLRALLATCYMFLGRNELSAIANAPLLQLEWVQIVAWLIHLLALYITAGTAIVAVGARVVRKLNLWLARRGRLNILYGVSADTLSLGKQLKQNKGESVVFVGGSEACDFENSMDASGCVLRTDANAMAGDQNFLTAVGMNRRRKALTVYALSKDPAANIRYAKKLLSSLQSQKVAVERTRLVILCPEDRAVMQLQVKEGEYGYGYVAAVNEADLAARLLVRSFRPCEHIAFDADACATENFEALVVGFGRTGQAVLKQLIMHGQFEGSHFGATVFDPDYDRGGGYFTDANRELLEQYDIRFISADGRSARLYEHLRKQGNKLRYVVVCTGDQKRNDELAQDICQRFRQMKQNASVYCCSRQGVQAYDADGLVYQQNRLYTPELLGQEQLDNRAMLLNYGYQKDQSRIALQHWMSCDYFSRQSCRASADFVEAMLYAAGKNGIDDWCLTSAQQLNLSKTEHLRWCAFHYCMGYTAMTQAEFDSRGEEYRRQLAETGKPTIRIAKNTADRTHACLCSWEELKLLSQREALYTGLQKDYQIMDTENVMAIPVLLRAEQ